MGETQDGIHPKLGTNNFCVFVNYELATYGLCYGGYMG
jgi:hypothetical protein